MQKWEYLDLVWDGQRGQWIANGVAIPVLKGKRRFAILSEMGDEGWELVGFDNWILIFKRPKP